MSDTPDTSPTVRFEGQPVEYTPQTDPLMHRVVVKDEVEPGLIVKFGGFQTDIPGAKVNLQRLAELNKNMRAKDTSSPGRYEIIYFTTTSGTIYRVRNVNGEEGTWQVESSTTPQQNIIREASTIEVGQRFTSPHLINDKSELNTSPVKTITLVDENAKPVWMGAPVSHEETNIAQQFQQINHTRGTEVQ